MLEAIKKFFDTHIAEANEIKEDVGHRLRVATAALLLETARADFSIDDDEMRHVADSLQTTFELSAQETDELLALAKKEAQLATCYHEFTSLINNGFSLEEKIQVVELMWQVAYSDNVLEKYEEALIRKIAELLYVPHGEFIAAKHRAVNRNAK
ncbi:tellurite resistance TerB family protein [Kaarinaea lacus]